MTGTFQMKITLKLRYLYVEWTSESAILRKVDIV